MLLQIAVVACIVLVLGISTSVGIGGATLINVLLTVGFGYQIKESIFITYIFLMGGGLAATIVGANNFTPKGRRLIDYDLVLITLPMLMSGSIFGTILNHFVSEEVITMLFIVLIFYVLRITCQEMRHNDQSHELTEESANSLKEQLMEIKPDLTSKHRLEEIIKEQQSLLPMQKFKIVFHIYVYTIVLVLFRGGIYFDSIIGLDQCNIGSWICVILHFTLSYLYCKSIAIKKFQQEVEKESLGFIFEDIKEKMSYQKMREAMFNGFLAGLLGSCLAISGGLVLIPLWVKAGVDRDVVANSTAPLIFFGASISSFISLLLGFYQSFLLVLLFFLVSFLGSYYIKYLIRDIEQKGRIKTIKKAIMILLMLASLGVFLPLQYRKYRDDPESFAAFRTFC